MFNPYNRPLRQTNYPMRAFIRNFLSSSAVSSTAVVTAGSLIGNIFAYFLQILLARILTIADFGTFTALLSVQVIIGALTTTVFTSLVKLVSRLSTRERANTLTRVFSELSMLLLAFGLLLLAGFYLLRFTLMGFLNIEDAHLLVYFGAFFALSFLTPVPRAYLQGLLRFGAFSVYTIITQFLRLAVPLGAAAMGLGLHGVFGGLAISLILDYAVGYLMLRRNLDFNYSKAEGLRQHFKGMLFFAGIVFFMQVGVTLLSNIDVVLVKHFLDPTSTGIYAGLITAGKVLLFGAGMVGTVMYPMIAAAFERKEDVLRKFWTFLGIQIFAVGAGVLLFSLMPETIVNTMFGSRYSSAIFLLPKFSVFIGAFVLVNFMALFFLAVEWPKAIWLFLPAVTAQLVLITRYHSSLEQIVNINLIASLGLLLGMSIYFAVYALQARRTQSSA